MACNMGWFMKLTRQRREVALCNRLSVRTIRPSRPRLGTNMSSIWLPGPITPFKLLKVTVFPGLFITAAVHPYPTSSLSQSSREGPYTGVPTNPSSRTGAHFCCDQVTLYNNEVLPEFPNHQWLSCWVSRDGVWCLCRLCGPRDLTLPLHFPVCRRFEPKEA